MRDPILPERRHVPAEFLLPYEDEVVRGMALRRFWFPRGMQDPQRAVLCVPGLAVSGRSFARLAPLSHKYAFRMLTTPLAVPVPGDPVNTLGDLIADYAERYPRPVLFGTSFGSLVALRAALETKAKLAGVVLVAALASGKMVPRRYAAFSGVLRAPRPIAWLAAPMAAQVLGGRALDGPARTELVRESRLLRSAELYRRVKAVLHSDLLGMLAKIEVPVLLVHGTRDRIIPVRQARKLSAQWPHAEYREIDGAGHLPYITHPEAFLSVLEPFLDRAFAGTAHAPPKAPEDHSPLP